MRKGIKRYINIAGKIVKWLGIITGSLILVVAIVIVVALNYQAVFARHKIDGIETYASTVTELEIPENVKIVGLGEATHGNVEFQELKLSVLQQLVNKYGYQAFGLEVDFGDALALNAYIQGEQGNVKELLSKMSYPIYHTEQMVELIEWMREYNDKMPEEKKLHFFGFDMQSTLQSAAYLVKYCEARNMVEIDTELQQISRLTSKDTSLVKEDASNLVVNLQKVQELLREEKEQSNTKFIDWELENAIHTCETLQQAMESFLLEDISYYEYRDHCLAQNVEWMQKQMEKLGEGKIMISAHNGHVTKSLYEDEMVLGVILEEMYGDSYYVIGTDFFHANVNINDSAVMSEEYSRSNHSFCSADSLAYQAKYEDENMYYLDFSKVTDQNSEVFEHISQEQLMGSIGEGYMWVWYLFPESSYRVKEIPTEMYDAMVLVYETTPIQPW